MNKDPRLAGSEFLDIWDYPLLQSANVLICTHFHALVDSNQRGFPNQEIAPATILVEDEQLLVLEAVLHRDQPTDLGMS